MKSFNIAIGADDAGFELKQDVVAYLRSAGHTITDYGVKADEHTPYPDVATTVAEAVAGGKHERGILICGTGIGVSIAANKVPGIRAAVCHDPYSTERSRMSNDCQIMALGARVVARELALNLVEIWLKSEFQGGRSIPKVNRLIQIEKQRNL